ncbi:hypothetical protein BDZ89DRAFT_1056638, partial [Hymenopellis radicata]
TIFRQSTTVTWMLSIWSRLSQTTQLRLSESRGSLLRGIRTTVDYTTLANYTSKREHCQRSTTFDHRNSETGLLEQVKLDVLPCSVKIHAYGPLGQYHQQFSFKRHRRLV